MRRSSGEKMILPMTAASVQWPDSLNRRSQRSGPSPVCSLTWVDVPWSSVPIGYFSHDHRAPTRLLLAAAVAAASTITIDAPPADDAVAAGEAAVVCGGWASLIVTLKDCGKSSAFAVVVAGSWNGRSAA